MKFKENIIDNTSKFKKNFRKFKKEFFDFFKEKGKMKKIKRWLKIFWKFILRRDVLNILLLTLPFIIIDISTRLFGSAISFYGLFRLTPRLFAVSYIVLFVGISTSLKNKYGKILYSVLFWLFFILYLVQNIYYSTMSNFFSFSLMALAGEGSDYAFDALKNANILIYVIAAILIAIYVFSMRLFPHNSKFERKKLISILIIFICLHIGAKIFLGVGNFELTWDNWRNPRNVYNNFNDSNKCMALSGFYEYSIRDFYVTFIRPEEKKSETENNFLSDVFHESNDSFNKNKYTARFANKNVIFLQLEGIDNWLLTKDIMPNTYSLLNNSLNFTNHYSYYNGGGSTFNSEFMVNTGYMTPFTYPMNAYTLNKNDFPYSMANLMKQKDYSIQAYHMNTKEYYSRGINYFNWGYDNYLGLQDLGTYTDNSYQLDRELVLNETFYDAIFNHTGKFVSYIITYSNHLPFDATKGVCNQLIKLDYATKLENLDNSEKKEFIENLGLTEEDCIKRQAKETDYMVGLLMQALKDNNLYNNTVLVVYADHYLYTVSDKEILKKNGKTIDNNLINKTPFFIWSANMKKEEIKKVNSQIDILPTVLNLLGINYNEKWYVGKDILSNNYKSMIVFPDLSWYDGTYYVENNVVINNKKISIEKLEEKNSYAEFLIKKNDLVLKYNYFKDMLN